MGMRRTWIARHSASVIIHAYVSPDGFSKLVLNVAPIGGQHSRSPDKDRKKIADDLIADIESVERDEC
jgi:hypothetical protein